jgi:hypothetical protein
MEKNQLLFVVILLLLGWNANACDKSVDVTNQKHLMVFVSSSMPIAALKAYAKEADKRGAAMVIKGLVDGSFIQTRRWIQSISDEASVQIDEQAFEQFAIENVPAIVLVKDKDCFVGDECHPVFDKVSGNVSVKYALELFTKDGDVKDE